MASEIELAPSVRDDDEGLFSRDVNGQLVRVDTPTENDYNTVVTLFIDGQKIEVKLAKPSEDAQGNIITDIEGQTTPRYTTIYDAAYQLYVIKPLEEAAKKLAAEKNTRTAGAEQDFTEPDEDAEKAAVEESFPIPKICHQFHMTPVAVCRLCVVQIYGTKRGKRAAERKLLPACQHPVKEGMEVFTMKDPGRDGQLVRDAVKVLVELLTADNLKLAPDPAPAADLAPFNELKQLADKCGVTSSRFKSNFLYRPVDTDRKRTTSWEEIDSSSPVFLVDHTACILCDRCSRACDEVNKNNVIGRTGKGPTAAIGFDLNDPMGESSCVQCGECMVSCPTSAITFKPVARVEIKGNKK